METLPRKENDAQAYLKSFDQVIVDLELREHPALNDADADCLIRDALEQMERQAFRHRMVSGLALFVFILLVILSVDYYFIG